MSTRLQPEQLARYARHLTLPEIGERGQLRLLAIEGNALESTLANAPVGTEAVWQRYLMAAGVTAAGVASSGGTLSATSPEAVLIGAASAVETMKGILGVGASGQLVEMLEVFGRSETAAATDRREPAERGR